MSKSKTHRTKINSSNSCNQHWRNSSKPRWSYLGYRVRKLIPMVNRIVFTLAIRRIRMALMNPLCCNSNTRWCMSHYQLWQKEWLLSDNNITQPHQWNQVRTSNLKPPCQISHHQRQAVYTRLLSVFRRRTKSFRLSLLQNRYCLLVRLR